MTKKRRKPQALQAGARVLGYGRFSQGPEQERSTEQQRADLERRAARDGWSLVEWYADESRSGTTTEGRDQFRALIDRCLEHPDDIDAVVVWELSRFSRNEADSAYFVGMLERMGIAVVSLNEPLPAGPVASIMRAAYAFGAAEESRKLSLRVRRGHLSMLAQGYMRGGKCPLGYRVEQVAAGTKINGDVRYNARWVIDEEAAVRVRKAFELYADGWPIASIHEATHAQKSIPAYAWLFANSTYIGTLRYGDSEFPGAVPAIIDTATWNRCQARKAEHPPARRRRSSYLLSGLLVCGRCGRPMNGHNNGKIYRYYICITQFFKPWEKCPARFVRAEPLEQNVIDRLLAHLSPENIDAIEAELRASPAVSPAGRQLAQTDAAIARTEKAIANLWAAVEDGSTAARAQLHIRESELTALQDKRATLLSADAPVDAALEPIDRTALLAALTAWRESLLSTDMDKKRVALHRFIERITITDGQIDIFYRLFVL